MRVHYGRNRDDLRYVCSRGSDYGDPSCQSVAGRVLDELVARQILAVLQPASLDLSLRAAGDLQKERERLAEQWRQRRERTRYLCERAERQYQAVEPENRLVARELERRWEQALAESRQVEADWEQLQRTQPVELTSAEREQILALAGDIPAMWQSQTTTASDRQRIVRCLAEHVTATVDPQSNQVAVRIRWAGGQMSEHEALRPVSRYRNLANYEQLLSRIDELRGRGMSLSAVAGQLDQEGFSPPKRALRFTGEMLGRLLRQLKGRTGPRPQAMTQAVLCEHEWWLGDLASHLGIPEATLFGWARRGWVQTRKIQHVARGRWAVWADNSKQERLTRLHECPRTWEHKPLLEKLCVPQRRPAC